MKTKGNPYLRYRKSSVRVLHSTVKNFSACPRGFRFSEKSCQHFPETAYKGTQILRLFTVPEGKRKSPRKSLFWGRLAADAVETHQVRPSAYPGRLLLVKNVVGGYGCAYTTNKVQHDGTNKAGAEASREA